MLLLLVTQAEDIKEERKEEEVGDGHTREHKDTDFRSETCVFDQISGGVGG